MSRPKGSTNKNRPEVSPDKIVTRGRYLTSYELETTINFNKGDDMADVFTYEKMWQRHIEKRMGIKPILDNGFGGKGYKIPKKLIPKPRVPKAKRIMTDEQKDVIRKRFAKSMGRE